MSRDGGSDELDLLLIDGDNLLHDVRGNRDEGSTAWLLPRLSGWRPEHMRIIVGLDGHPAQGEARRQRVTRGIEFHHSGSRSADDMLIELLKAQPYAGRGRTAVVTRDRALQARASRAGGVTRSVAWLMDQVAGRPPAGSRAARSVGIGQGKPPRMRIFGPPDAGGEEPTAWQPGRGATRKKGNPRRSPKGSRRR